MDKLSSVDPPRAAEPAQGAAASTAAAATLAVLFGLGAATTWGAPLYLGRVGVPLFVGYLTMALLMAACAVLMHLHKSRLMAAVILVMATLISVCALGSGNVRLAVFVAFALPCAGLGLRRVWANTQPEFAPVD